jgi:peptidyl-prolyl cis-trans isomerase SurA
MYSRASSKVSILLCSVFLSLISYGVARAGEAPNVDQIAAVVGQEIILLSEVREESLAALMELEKAAQGNGGGMMLASRKSKVFRETLDQMINIALVGVEARSMELSVGTEEIDRAMANMARENSIDTETLRQAIVAQGMDYAAYRAKLRKQILKFKVLNLRVRARISITDAEARQYYNNQVRDVRATGSYEGAHILLRVLPNARAAEVARVRKRAEEFKDRIAAGEEFDKIAVSESQDSSTARHGGSLGKTRPGEIPSVLERSFFDLEVGELAGPIRTPAGFHLIRLNNREALGVQPFAEVKDRITTQLAQEEMMRQEKIWLKELRLRTFIDVRM